MGLIEEIDLRRKEIRTDGYAMSVGEWISLYEKGELDIHPEFQRFYRWSETQKTNLIESILLGIPIPPIFVSQRKDGVWDVVDGLQRLSTIFQLVGILKDENGKIVEPLILNQTKYLPGLNGLQWENLKDKSSSLPPESQLSIKRSKISVSIILKESDENAKYDLFQRLNTGGSILSPQEVRNCLLVMANKKLFDWIHNLANYPSFQEVGALSERAMEESYDMELVLRFLVMFNLPIAKQQAIGDVGVFITDRMTEIARDKRFPYVANEKIFKQTFDLLLETVNDNAFKKYNKTKDRHEGGFLVSLFEVVALGIGFNIKNGTIIGKTTIAKKLKSIWDDQAFTSMATPGMNASRRIPRLIPYGRKLFKK